MNDYKNSMVISKLPMLVYALKDKPHCCDLGHDHNDSTVSVSYMIVVAVMSNYNSVVIPQR